MNDEPNKPIEAEELTDKELEGIVGGTMPSSTMPSLESLTAQAGGGLHIYGS